MQPTLLLQAATNVHSGDKIADTISAQLHHYDHIERGGC